MGSAVEDMKRTDFGQWFLKGADAGDDFMSKHFRIYSGINESWADFLRRSAGEGNGENAGRDLSLRKTMEVWQQWPSQALLRCASSAETMKGYMRYCFGRQQTYTDLAIASLDCMQKMSQACREARQNGSGPAEAWTGCLKAWAEFAGAEAAFATERVKAFFHLMSLMAGKEGTTQQTPEAGGVPAAKASRV